MNLLHPESLIFWSVITFIILLFLLKKFAWGPILSAVETREKTINDALSAADEAKRQMEQLKSDNEKLLLQAKAERDALLKEARELKDQMIAQAKEEASKQAGNLLQQAKDSIENEKKTALAELRSQVALWSLDIAEKLVRKELSDKQKQEQLVEQMLKETTLN